MTKNLKLKQIAIIERHRKLGVLTLIVGLDTIGEAWDFIPKKGWIKLPMNIIEEK